MAIAARASTSSRVSALPQGLCGELITSSFVRSVTSEATSFGSIRNWFSSRSGTATGVASAKAVIDSYMGKPGFG